MSRPTAVFGLRSRLLTLVLLAVVPALGLLTYTNFAQRQQQIQWVQEGAKRLTRSIASTEERYILATRQMLMSIAETPFARGSDKSHCVEYLKALTSKNPIYTLIEITDRKGDPICTSATRNAATVADREYFKKAMSTGEFAISEFQIGRVSGLPIVTFAYPLRGDERGPAGIALASHNLTAWVKELSKDLQLPRGVTMTLFDRTGRILAGYPAEKAEKNVLGRMVADVTTWATADPDQVRLTQNETTVRADMPLVHDGQLAGTVRVELSVARAFEQYDRIFHRNGLLLGLVLLLGLIAAWKGSDFFVLRQTRALVDASHRLAGGDLKARTGVAYGHDELGHLARVFDEMASSLETREAQLVNAERHLAAARLSSVLDITADAIVRLDPKGRITLFNRGGERVLGYRTDDVLGQPVTAMLAEASVATFRQALERAAASAEQTVYESLRVDAKRADGRMFPAEVTLSRLVESGETSFTMVLRDITERVAAEQQQLAVQRQRAEVERLESLAVLAGGVAHDFNNLLVAVIGNACLGMEETPKGSALHRYFSEIETAAQRAAGLSLQMLAYSGRSYVVSRRVNLTDVVADAANAAQAALPAGIKLDVRANTSLPEIDGDPAQLKQLLTNLVTNAAEAIGDAAGTITLITGMATQPARGEGGDAAGEHIYVKVADTGPGIPDDIKSRIFEPFFSTKFTGRGLGLAVVSGIVRAHAGFVLVESVPGHGATFTIMFPKLAVAAAKADVRRTAVA